MNYNFDVEIATKIGVDEAIMLNNFVFWLTKNKANNKNLFDGNFWTFNSVRAYCELFPFWKESQIKRILKSLIEQNVLVVGNYNQNAYDRTNWYALSTEYIYLIDWSISANGVDNNSQPIPDKNTDKNTNKNKDINYDELNGGLDGGNNDPWQEEQEQEQEKGKVKEQEQEQEKEQEKEEGHNILNLPTNELSDKDFTLSKLTSYDNLSSIYKEKLEEFLNKYIEDLELKILNANGNKKTLQYEDFILSLEAKGYKYKNFISAYKTWNRGMK